MPFTVTSLASPETTLTAIPRTGSRERISDLVTTELTQAVRDLRLPPGAPLSETELARTLGVSRTPLREAISRLVDQGLIVVLPQVGTRVALIDHAEVDQAVFIRTALETAAFRAACAVEERDVGRLRQLLERQERAVAEQDREEFFVTDEAIHQELFRLAGQPMVWSVVRRSKIQLDRLRQMVIGEALQGRTIIDEHILLVDLLEQGDADTGVEVLTRHALRAIHRMPSLRASQPAFFTE